MADESLTCLSGQMENGMGIKGKISKKKTKKIKGDNECTLTLTAHIC